MFKIEGMTGKLFLIADIKVNLLKKLLLLREEGKELCICLGKTINFLAFVQVSLAKTIKFFSAPLQNYE